MIVVFGSINADLVARVAVLPRVGETQTASDYAVHAGGKGANQALAARHAGAEVALVGAVGTDSYAEVALRALSEAGVELSGVARSDRPTGLALIHVDALGRNTITVVTGANGIARADALPFAALGPRTVVVVQLEMPQDQVVALALRAHARDARVIVNVAPPVPLTGALLDSIDVLVANEHEAAFVARDAALPSDPAAFCEAAADRWKLVAVVTLGAQGLVAADPTHRYRMPAVPVDVRDTTAAGDAFIGALAAALDRGVALRDALADGVAAGSHACTIHGAQPSIGRRGLWHDAARAIASAASVEAR